MNYKKKASQCILYTIILLVLVEFDQITKRLAALKLTKPVVLIDNVLELQYLENKGAAFSLLNNSRIFFLIITAIFFVAAVWFFIRLPETRRYLPLRILTLLIAAGAVGNFIDRLVLSYVRDFIYFSLINFPVFNVADIYITVSGILFVIFILFVYKDQDFYFLKNPKEPQRAVKEPIDTDEMEDIKPNIEIGLNSNNDTKLKEENIEN